MVCVWGVCVCVCVCVCVSVSVTVLEGRGFSQKVGQQVPEKLELGVKFELYYVE
jgi:hypothetical protein